MDDDTLALVRQLCTRAGTLMEDASVVALVWDPAMTSLGTRLARLSGDVAQMDALVRAAQALLEEGD